MSFPMVDGVEVLMPPPPDRPSYPVNLTHPYEVDTDTINGSYWAFGIEFPFACLFLAQRIYTSLFVTRNWRSDDSRWPLSLAVRHFASNFI
ncbi:hypothetical protein IMZ48_06210, partial [Candidatus Bathyarchaeota archaeon]|nr:hypothetical protein [Candidatus Bathyarchaeota archaeon]